MGRDADKRLAPIVEHNYRRFLPAVGLWLSLDSSLEDGLLQPMNPFLAITHHIAFTIDDVSRKFFFGNLFPAIASIDIALWHDKLISRSDGDDNESFRCGALL